MARRRRGAARAPDRESLTATAPTPIRPLNAEFTITATKAQNAFGQILERAEREQPVVITRRAEPTAVLVSMVRYRQLLRTEASVLDTLTDQFDALVTRMQTPTSRAGVAHVLRASGHELGLAAVAKVAKVAAVATVREP